MKYEIIENEDTSILKRTDDDGTIWFIPMDESNSDYQRYLNPEAEHFTPSVTSGDQL